MLKYLVASFLALSLSAMAQTITAGDGSTVDTKLMGDVDNSASQSTSQQINPSANANGNDMSNANDVRNQNTTTSAGGAATGGAAIGNQSDNKSSASNGNQTMGQANTGTVGNTSATTGPISNQNVASGGAGGKGGAGGSASNLGINGQQQGIAGSGNSDNRNALTGGAQTNAQRVSAGNGAGAGAGSGNRTSNTTVVDAADRSSTTYASKAVAHAPIIHGPAAPALATASMVVQPGVCGPRHYTEQKPVIGTHHGVIWDSEVLQGNDYTVVPATVPFIMKDGYLMGHRINEYVAVLGTSSSKSLSIQGYGKEQNGGGGGAAVGGSHQQIVVRVTVTECLMQTERPAPVVMRPLPTPVEISLPPRADRE